jgi:CheY-like chemotaxis protein
MGTDSIATCRTVVGHAIGSSVPVVAVTDSAARGDAAKYRSVGVAAYLTEPISTLDIVDATRMSVALSQTEGKTPLITGHWLRKRRARYHILVADDSPTNQVLTQRILEARGHSVTVAMDGVEAVNAVARESFDAVLMDIQMPNMDGLEATIAIRRRESQGGHHLPIVALTAHAMIEDRDRCFEAGADAYVPKPFNADELLGTIERLATHFSQIRDQDRPT